MNIDGKTLRDAIISGANNISNNRSSVDELNVFPVPDGDTGTNMSMTIGASVAELSRLPDDVSVETVAAVAASALLRGARGNSGVILSLLFRGFKAGLKGCAEMSSEDICASLQKGVASAYKAVMVPTEGTMLTVAREASEKAAGACAGKTPQELWSYVVECAEDTLSRTPDMLPVLKKAGVVDSGGQGLVIIFKGMQAVFEGGEPIKSAQNAASTAEDKQEPGGERELEGRYFTEFSLTRRRDANDAKLSAFLESIGDNVSLSESDGLVVCRLNTKHPGKAIEEALKQGSLSKVRVESLYERQLARKSETRASEREAQADGVGEDTAADGGFQYAEPDDGVAYGFVSVSSGDGLAELFRDLGVDRIVSGGQTMNPSTEDILAAIQSIPAKNIIVLANNKNIIMASEQACKLADRKAVVLPTRTITQGISAMLAFSPEATLEENIIGMNDAADNVASGQVTFAARDSEFDGKSIKSGDILGIADGKLVVNEKSVEKAVVKLTKKLVKKNTSFVTVIAGTDVGEELQRSVNDALTSALPSDIELTFVYGGQPVYYFYISAE